MAERAPQYHTVLFEQQTPKEFFNWVCSLAPKYFESYGELLVHMREQGSRNG